MSLRGLRLALAPIALALGAAPAAFASTLSTPLVSAGTDGQIICIATNVGTKPAEVSAEAVNLSGEALTFELNFCNNATLAPKASCYARLAAGADGACIFTYRGTVKAALQVYDLDAEVASAIIPATR
jgi:hypothetical protein